jgi:hypothetical protein
MGHIHGETSFLSMKRADSRLMERYRYCTPSSSRRFDTFLGPGGQGCQSCHYCAQRMKEGVASMLVICLHSTGQLS